MLVSHKTRYVLLNNLLNTDVASSLKLESKKACDFHRPFNFNL